MGPGFYCFRLTIIASISLSETGVRLGCREAFPPTAVFWGGAGTSDLRVDFWLASSFVACCVCEAEPMHQNSRNIFRWNELWEYRKTIKQAFFFVTQLQLGSDSPLLYIIFLVLKHFLRWKQNPSTERQSKTTT